MKKNLVLAHTSFLGFTGYNNHSREFFTHLNDLIPVRVRNYTHTPDLSYLTEIQKQMLIYQEWGEPPWKVGSPFNPGDYDTVVDLVLNETNHYFFHDRYSSPKIFYNVWESTRQPDDFFQKILEANQFWVPTKWQRDCTIEQGYPKDRIKVVPEGVDGNIFYPGGDEWDDGYFYFLIFGRWDYRKSIKEIIEAFLSEFGFREKVRLMCSVDNPFSVDGMNLTEERLEYYGLEDDRVIIKHFLPFNEYVKHLQSGHALVSCSRSEGWNLPLIEAIACGIPTICSDYGAQLDFAYGSSTLKVKIKEHKPVEQIYFHDDVPGTWAEPDYKDLQRAMRQCFEEYEDLRNKAIADSKRIRKEFSWENAARTGHKYVSELIDNNDTVLVTTDGGENVTVKGKFVDDLKNNLKKMFPKDKILITNSTLNNFRGTELYVYTLARALVSQGNEVVVYSPDIDVEKNKEDTRLIGMFDELGVKVFYDMGLMKLEHKDFDVVHVHHTDCLKHVKHYYPDLPTVFVSHGVLPDQEKVSKNLSGDINVAVSEEVFDHNFTDVDGYSKVIIRNIIDDEIFSKTSEINDEPKRLLVISNYIDNEKLDIIFDACVDLEIDCSVIGKKIGRVEPNGVAEEINKSDIIISLGRGVIEAMMCGRIPIVFDYNGGDGMVTSDNFEELMKRNFSGRTLNKHFTKEELKSEILKYNKEDSDGLRYLAKNHFSKDIIFPQLIDAYNDAVKTKRPKEKIEDFDDIFVIGCYPDDDYKVRILDEKIDKIKEIGLKTIVVSHHPIPPKIQSKVDMCLYDSENVLSGEWKLNYWYNKPGDVKVVGKCKNGNYQSVAIISSIKHALRLTNYICNMHYIESDTEIDIKAYLEKVRDKFNEGYKFVSFCYDKEQEALNKRGIVTNVMSFDVQWMDSLLPSIHTWEEYESLAEKYAELSGRPSDLIFENWLHNFLLVAAPDEFIFLSGEDKENILIERNLIDSGSSEPEVRSFVSETDDGRIVLFVINNSNDKIKFSTHDDETDVNSVIINNRDLEPHHHFYKILKKESCRIFVMVGEKIIDRHIINADESYDETQFVFYDDRLKCIKWDWGEVERAKPIQEEKGVSVNLSFINQPRLELSGEDGSYVVWFKDADTEEVIHSDILKIKNPDTVVVWTSPNRRFFTRWRVEVFRGKDLVFQETLDLKGKRVLIYLDSGSLGDTIAWIPYLEKFAEKHDCKVIASTFWNRLFESRYPDMEFVLPGTVVDNLAAQYTIGGQEDHPYLNKIHWKTIPLQQVSSDILGLDFEEIKPRIITGDKLQMKKPYVCISEHSTMQSKYWNRYGGWQKIVDYLKVKGFEVLVISKEESSLKRVKYKTNRPIETTMKNLRGAEFFIGVSSGLSWLAWTLGVPAIIISGCTHEYTEFKSGSTRLINKKVCHGCLSDPNVDFNKSDWMYCPYGKKFECTKMITEEDVKQAIDKEIFFREISLPPNGWMIKKYDYDDIFIHKSYYYNDCRINHGDTVLDIGANVGLFASFAKQEGADRVVSYEANYKNYEYLMKNKPDICEAENAIVLNRSGSERLYINKFPGGHSILESAGGDFVNVTSININEIINSVGHVNFMKLDVEGAEYDILNSIDENHFDIIDNISLEFHKMILGEEKMDELIQKLNNFYHSFVLNYRGGHLSMIYFWKK